MLTNILKSLLQPRSQAPVYCRICLRPNEDLHPLDSCLKFGFDVSSVEKLSLQHLLKDVSGCEEVLIGSMDGLCERCLEGLVAAFLFKKRCLKADQTIRHAWDLLEKIVQNAETAGPTTTILAQISLVTTSEANNIRLKNYESHENNSSELRFINEILEPEISICEDADSKTGSKSAAKKTKTARKEEKSKDRKSLRFRCEFCGKCFQYLCTLNYHLQYHSERTHKCDMCPKSFKTHNDLRQHLKRHYSRITFGCALSKLNLESKRALTEHRELLHVSKKKSYTCDHCGTAFVSRYTFVEHLKDHNVHMEQRSPSPSEEGDEILASKSSLDDNLKRDRSISQASADKKSKEKVLCPLCGKLITKATIKAHLEIHGARTYACTVCDKKFKTKNSLYTHNFKHMPSNEKHAYACHHCGVTRRTKSILATHLLIHEPKGAYPCNVCNKVFARELYLKNHKLTHLNIRPEQCDICDNRFVNKKALLYHKRIHTGEKPYECETCGENFLSSSRRNDHIKRSHTEKQVSCTICGSLFHTRSQVNRHVKIVHLKIRRMNNVVDVKSEHK